MTIKKAILKSFNSAAYTATVELAGSARAYLTGVKVARHIPSAEMVIARTVFVAFPDRNNPADAVIIAVF